MDEIYRSAVDNNNNDWYIDMERKLFPVIEKKKWRKVRRLLKSHNRFELCQEQDTSKLSCLALALGHNAPIEIIQEMVGIDPSLCNSRDFFGATVLHVACLNGASIETIQFIVSQNADLVASQDFDLRSPLHHAVEQAIQSVERDNLYLPVIELLSSLCPEMVFVCDKDGDTPIDLVQILKADINPASDEYARLHEIYSRLRQVGVDIYTKNRNQWEIEGYLGRLKLCADQKTASTGGTSSLGVSDTDDVTSHYSNPCHESKKGIKRTLEKR